MSRPTRYPPPFRAGAVAEVARVRLGYRSEWQAIEAVAAALGVSPETLRGWIRRSETPAQDPSENDRLGAEVRRLSKENAQLREALHKSRGG